MPSTVPSSVAAGATIMMSRAPTITRESMSRPTRSVPNRWSDDGAARSLSGSVAYGSSGASGSPKIAQITNTPRIAAPAMNVLDRRSSAEPLALRLALLVGDGRGGGGRRVGAGDRAHCSPPSRTRGLRTEYAMSAISVATR